MWCSIIYWCSESSAFRHWGLPGPPSVRRWQSWFQSYFFILYTYRRVDLVKYGLVHPVHYSWRKLRRMLDVSFWTMIQNFISLSTWFLFFLFVEHLGERALAVTNVVRNISGIPFMVVAAFASTCSALVSNLIGAGREDMVMSTIRQHVRLTFYDCVADGRMFCSFFRE